MVEDPIEYRLAGVTQVQVNANAGLGFPQVLRSMLRQDPDVIVVGEMRDEDTARIGLEAAMTGHLLLTSLHANHAIAAVQRLENLGTGRALIAQSIHLVLVQRLVRKLCSACRKLDPPVPALLESLVARRIVDKGQQTSDLHARQKANDTYQAALRDYGAKYRTTTIPEPTHAMPDRLVNWCRVLRLVFGKSENGPTAQVMGKVYRLADRIAARVGGEPVARESAEDLPSAVRELGVVIAWCETLVTPIRTA